MPAEHALIHIRDVEKRFGRKRVLKRVNLQVQAGEIVALLGANGAGKTTLMRIVAGLAKADRGEVRLGGATAASGGHELRRYIGFVSHAPLLYDNLSALENLRFFAQLYDLVDAEPRIEAILRRVTLWARRRDPVRMYSRGMVQRLAIARAILHDPPVLLLDEPDTGLDPDSADDLHGLIQLLGASERAILLSTHNLERAVSWANSVCMLADGNIAFRHSTDTLIAADLERRYREVNAS